MSQPENFARDDIPAAVAPFAAADLRRATSATLALYQAAGPYVIGFDRWKGVITFERDGTSFDIFPFMLLQEGPDRSRELAPIAEERREAVLEAVLRLWGGMVEDLIGLVAIGRMKAVAREDSPKARYLTILPEGAFALFELTDWEHGIAKCKFTGETIFNLHFREATEDQELSSKPLHFLEVVSGHKPTVSRSVPAKTEAIKRAVAAQWPGGIPEHLPAKERDAKIMDWSRKNGGASGISARQIQRVLRRSTTRGDK